MTELAINAAPEMLVLGGFVVGFTLALFGAGVRLLIRFFDGGDPEI